MSKPQRVRESRVRILPGDSQRAKVKDELRKMMEADEKDYQEFMKRTGANIPFWMSKSRSKSPDRSKISKNTNKNNTSQNETQTQQSAAEIEEQLLSMRREIRRLQREELNIQAERMKALGQATKAEDT
eukprot:NODE_9058_length_623_cov_45.590000_g8430_i0.p1 GENE.NODE_9058_length_623_cov_45.590000_g8430_i0~~NODE_9058_length_623_cov_45.590000_g8430_i0.p1  ORF type:complete len:129 (-),score=32.37 NODE_9058_length_623_cov_45.590000_g8430_i0:143-529(-)